MKNKVSKMLISIILVLTIFSLFTTEVEATTSTTGLGGIISGADGFLNQGTDSVPLKIKEMSDMIYNILLILGIVIAVIVGMVIGMKFMTGGAEEKAKVKEMLVPYIAGCIVIFGAFTIWKIVVTILQAAN